MELEIRNNWDFVMCVGEYLDGGTRHVAGDIWRKREGFLAFYRRFRRSLRRKTEGFGRWREEIMVVRGIVGDWMGW